MTGQPRRIQLSRRKGYRKPEGAVVVARPTKWGNPYRWTDYPAQHVAGWGDESTRIPASRRRSYAVVDFEAAIQYGSGSVPRYPSRDEIRRELAGKDLACWCPLGQPCHADVLLAIANPDFEPSSPRS